MGLLSPGDEVEPGEVGAEEGLVGGGVAAPAALALPCQGGGEDQDQQPAWPVGPAQPAHLNSETKILPHFTQLLIIVHQTASPTMTI